jgi:hypothetical protein
MNRQEIFDKVAVHLLTQGCKSEGKKPDGGTDCLYRGPNGEMCAAGCLISDEQYNPKMEGNSFREIAHELPEFMSDNEATGFVMALQLIHDCDHPDEWLESLKNTALKYNLNIEAITPFIKQSDQSSE